MTTQAEAPSKPQHLIDVTEKAAAQIQKIARAEGKEITGLRVMIKGGGCSGLSYKLVLDDQERPGDKVVACPHDLKVFVDAKSLIYLYGTVLDYSDGLNGKGFTFSNPNAKSTCGCGSSFSA